MERDNRQQALEKMLGIAAAKGYVTFDIIMSCADDYALSLPDLDWLSSVTATRGIIIYDTEPTIQETDEDEDVDDYAQIDYEAVYREIVSICPNLEAFVDEVRSIKPPQFRETSRLKYLVKEGNAHARDRMIEMHLRIALRVALQRAKVFDTDLEEAVSATCVGVINAVDRYDPDTSGPFASYASIWALQAISREQSTKNPHIYFPYHKKEQFFSAYPLLKERGCLDCDKYDGCVKARYMVAEKLSCPVDQVDDVFVMAKPAESLDTLIDNPDLDEAQIRFFMAQKPVGPEEIAEKNILHEQIMSLLSTLTPREGSVLKLRYGLEDGRERTLEEVGGAFKLTRERIRQIEKKALRKMRHPSRSKKIEPYWLVDVQNKQQAESKNNKKRKTNIVVSGRKRGRKPRQSIEQDEQNIVLPAANAEEQHDESLLENEPQKLSLLELWPEELEETEIENVEEIDEIDDTDEADEDELAVDLLEAIAESGLRYKDKRGKGGCLWVYGGKEIADVIYKLERDYGVKFRFKADGPLRSDQPAWWTVN